MDNNMYMGQLVGPFSANEELYDKVIEDAGTAILHIKHLGIQAEVSTIIFINGEEREARGRWKTTSLCSDLINILFQEYLQKILAQ